MKQATDYLNRLHRTGQQDKEDAVVYVLELLGYCVNYGMTSETYEIKLEGETIL